jgi:hypothetical protein
LYRLDIEVVATTPFIVEVIMPAFAKSVFELTAVVVDTLPFTFDVITFTADCKSLLFTNCAVVDEITPFVFDIRVKELVDVDTVKLLLVIIELVATTPFIILVNVFPVADWVKEFIKLVKAEVTPFTIFANELVVVEITFEFIIVEVPIDPPTFEVIVFTKEDSIFETDKFVTARLVPVAFVKVKLSVFVVEADKYCAVRVATFIEPN